MKFEAVVFDLYGTLVYEFPREKFFGVLAEMAGALGVPAEGFETEWNATALQRQTGFFATVEENVAAICAVLGVQVRGLEDAMAARRRMYDSLFRPKPGAVRALRGVRDRGLASALVSMCAPDTPALWRASELAGLLDVEVFSSEARLRKPEPEIYLLAAKELRVEPSACLYVGDGAYGELTGAAAVGMFPVLVRDPDEEVGTMLRPEVEEDWSGPIIGSIDEILGFLD